MIFPSINVQQEHLLQYVLENLKKLNFCSTLRELAGRYLSIIMNKSSFSCFYSEILGDVKQTDYEFNYDSFGVVLQYVICLLPCLIQKKEYEQVFTILERTVFFFKSHLNDVKRIGFITNLLVHCQYDLENVKCERYESLRSFFFDLWAEIKASIDLTVANNEAKLYFIFGGMFMVDIYQRTKYFENSTELKKCLKQVQLNQNHDNFKKVLDPLLSSIIDQSSKRSEKIEPACNINQQLKLRVFVAVGGYRLYKAVYQCKNSVINLWTETIKRLGIDYTSIN